MVLPFLHTKLVVEVPICLFFIGDDGEFLVIQALVVIPIQNVTYVHIQKVGM